MATVGTVATEALVRLLTDLEALRRTLRLYPTGHPSVAPATTRIEAATRALGAEGVVVIGLGAGKLFLDGSEVALSPTSPARRLVQVLFKLGLAGIRCRLPGCHAGLAALVARLAPLHEPPGELDRQGLLEARASFAGIDLVPIDLSMIEVVEDGAAGPSRSIRWADFMARLGQDGVVPARNEPTSDAVGPEEFADLIAKAPDPAAVFDALFRHIGELLQGSPPDRWRALTRDTRGMLRELVTLLDTKRRRVAVESLAHRLSSPSSSLRDCEPFLTTELILDAVEFMLARHVPVPDGVREALAAMAQAEQDDWVAVPPGLARRAEALLERLRSPSPPTTVQERELDALRLLWQDTEWSNELAVASEESHSRQHLVGVLIEAMTLWPGSTTAAQAGSRLGEELVNALDLGELEEARRLAPIVAAGDAASRRAAVGEGAEAAVRALRAAPREAHATLVAVLSSLGEPALPAILQALAEEENRAVRKRLLEVVTGHGDRALPYIEPLLDDPRWYVVRNAIFLLRRIGGPETGAAIKRHLAHDDARVVEEILKALVAVEDPEWLPLLLREIQSEDAARMRVAVDVASHIAHPEVVAGLLAALQQRIGIRLREPVVLDLLRALGQLKDPAALPALRRVCELRQWRYPFSVSPIRREAALAIAQLPGDQAHEVATGLARDHDAELAAAVRAALHRQRTSREPG
ncbi:MAG: HEAT repeat domain-containing protein [Acidobacteriota bacterium]